MKREEVQEVFRAFYDSHHKAHPGDYRNLVAAPFESVQTVVSRLEYGWEENQIRLVAAVIGHPSSTQTIELMNDILSSENMIWDIIQSVRPATSSAIVMHVVTFSLGVFLTVSAIISAMQNQILVSTMLGGLALASFLFIFFRQPIRGVQRGINYLIQLEVIYNGYVKQLGYWKAYERSSDVSLKPVILEEIDKCTRHTLFLIQKYSERIPLSESGKPAPELFEPFRIPQINVPPKPFAEKMMIMDKLPISEKGPGTDSQMHLGTEAPAARVPPKMLVDAKRPDMDQIPGSEEESSDAAPVFSDENSGASPFVLATAHQANNWETIELSSLDDLLTKAEQKAVEIAQAIDEQNKLPASHRRGTAQYRRLHALHEQQRTLESELRNLIARKEALTGEG